MIRYETQIYSMFVDLHPNPDNLDSRDPRSNGPRTRCSFCSVPPPVKYLRKGLYPCTYLLLLVLIRGILSPGYRSQGEWFQIPTRRTFDPEETFTLVKPESPFQGRRGRGGTTLSKKPFTPVKVGMECNDLLLKSSIRWTL